MKKFNILYEYMKAMQGDVHGISLLTEFDEALWYETVKNMTVHSESDVAVTFKDGSEVHVDMSGK